MPSDGSSLPATEMRFYYIQPNDDGTVDVYLNPDVTEYRTEDGHREYDIAVLVVRGIVPWDGLEDDIRSRFDDWCESGDRIYL